MNRADVRFGTGKLNQAISVGTHSLVADVSMAEGGDATGPSPHDYLAVALGACTSMTLKMYAVRKAWPLRDARTTVTILEADGVARFARAITLVGELEAEQKTRLLEIANRCPVHKLLSGKIVIETRLEPIVR